MRLEVNAMRMLKRIFLIVIGLAGIGAGICAVHAWNSRRMMY